ncbi:MAG TPA: LamG-like jellyroll fold domain-containing protein, partial [bacterium]|nr:LamG-like jellyroll fold domain-containing protein [bacterium]
KPGYREGNPINIKLWATTYNNQVELIPDVSWQDCEGNFGESTYSTAQVTAKSGLEPIIKTSTDNINFQTVSINSKKTKKLFIYNEGESQLEIHSIMSSSNAFSANQNNFTIPAGASSTIDITFEPESEITYNETIKIQSNDPQQDVKVVNLSGTGFPVTNTNIDVSLTPLKFPSTAHNDTSQAELVLTNSGSGTINIYSVSTTNASFFVENDYFSIQPGQTYHLPVFFTPGQSQIYSGELNIHNNSQNMENINIELQGTGYKKYFQSVESTGLPYQIIVDRLEIPPQISSQVGDELGIFDNSLCVGSIIIDHDSTNINKKSIEMDNSYIELSNSEGLDPLYGDFTLEAWIKTADSSNTNQPILSKRHGQFNKTLQLRIDDGKAVFASTGNDHNVRVVSNVSINDNEWHHVAGVRKSFNLYLYVDGQLVNSANDVYNVNSSDAWKIGFDEISGNYFQGQLDEIRIWKTARTQNEIQKNMYKILVGDEQNLNGHWKCDAIINNTISDNSVNNLAGNISGEIGLTQPSPAGEQALEYYSGVAWQKEEGLPGFEPGDPIKIRYFAYRNGEKKVYDASFDYQEGDGNFGTGAYARGNVNVSSDLIRPFLATDLPTPQIMEDAPASVVISDLNNYFDHQYDTLKYELHNPDTSSLSANLIGNSRIEIKPKPNWFGTARLLVFASDGYSNNTDSLEVNVLPVNDPPRITSESTERAYEDD